MSVQDKLYVLLHSAQKFDALLDKKAFGQYLRRGVVDSAITRTREYLAEVMTEISDALYKFNENHDPDNGQFTSGDGVSVTLVPPTPVAKPATHTVNDRPKDHPDWPKRGKTGATEENIRSAAAAVGGNLRKPGIDGKPPRCAAHVREALFVGGIKVEPTHDAKDYGPKLEKAGLVRLSPIPASDYHARQGDVVVIQNHGPYVNSRGERKPAGNISGHMAMYDGTQWVSDFRQRDMWGGEGYRTVQPPYAIYRP